MAGHLPAGDAVARLIEVRKGVAAEIDLGLDHPAISFAFNMSLAKRGSRRADDQDHRARNAATAIHDVLSVLAAGQ
jgi:hypothetical protein